MQIISYQKSTGTCSTVLASHFGATLTLTEYVVQFFFFNSQAGLVEDVYKLDDLITMDEMSSLLEAAEELVVDYPNKEAVDGAVHARTFSKMFANHLDRFRKSPKVTFSYFINSFCRIPLYPRPRLIFV